MSEKRHIKASDLPGLARLAADATIGVTDLVEAMHRRIVHPPYVPSTPIQHLISGISGITFGSVRLVTRLVGKGMEKAWDLLPAVPSGGSSSEKRETALAILNGIMGDYLESTQNPLSIPMQLRHQGKDLTLDPNSIEAHYPDVNGKILLMIHGLCMNDLQWRRNGHDHGEELAKTLGLTPVYVHYNSGRHVSTNAQDLNVLLEQMVCHWPVPVEEIVIVAHSMGGLVSRSAFHYGEQGEKAWTQYLKKIVFLGTPHHGAPLEQAGNYIDSLLEAIAYVKPFARLGKLRSAGITDLRYGSLVDEDWEGNCRFEQGPDQRKHIPLPSGVACYSIAASTGKNPSGLSDLFLGDGLVLLESALGQHPHPEKDLAFKPAHTLVVYDSHHMDLLSSPTTYQQIESWLSEKARPDQRVFVQTPT